MNITCSSELPPFGRQEHHNFSHRNLGILRLNSLSEGLLEQLHGCNIAIVSLGIFKIHVIKTKLFTDLCHAGHLRFRTSFAWSRGCGLAGSSGGQGGFAFATTLAWLRGDYFLLQRQFLSNILLCVFYTFIKL